MVLIISIVTVSANAHASIKIYLSGHQRERLTMLAREKERERKKKLHIFCQLNYDLLNPNDPEWKCDTLHNVICFCMERKISNPSASVLSIIFSPSCWAFKITNTELSSLEIAVSSCRIFVHWWREREREGISSRQVGLPNN